MTILRRTLRRTALACGLACGATILPATLCNLASPASASAPATHYGAGVIIDINVPPDVPEYRREVTVAYEGPNGTRTTTIRLYGCARSTGIVLSVGDVVGLKLDAGNQALALLHPLYAVAVRTDKWNAESF